ncbi:hypothetical protein [Campylobacter concisus]|uniref:hypothetical protein n=1 Tax=Campylobacter concisus TaxID=199 RepID=UPI000CD90E92|nr:hypothetical protein [Campylobacter concisus]
MSYQEILELMKEKDKPEFTNEILVSTLLKFHPLILSGISLVGMIYYFAYFGIKVKYFLDLGGADVAYVGVSFFFISTFFSLAIIFPCLIYPGYYENKKDKTWMFYFGFCLLPFLAVVCMAALNTIVANKIMLIDLLIISLVVSSIYLFLIIYFDINTKDHSFFALLWQ